MIMLGQLGEAMLDDVELCWVMPGYIRLCRANTGLIHVSVQVVSY